MANSLLLFSPFLRALRVSARTLHNGSICSRVLSGLPTSRNASSSSAANKRSRQARRWEKLGITPDGKPLPVPNYKKVFPRLYKVLVVNQDGSTYTIYHRYPYCILTLPLDLSTLTPEQLAQRERARMTAKARVYVEEEGLEEEEEAWDQDKYRDLF